MSVGKHSAYIDRSAHSAENRSTARFGKFSMQSRTEYCEIEGWREDRIEILESTS